MKQYMNLQESVGRKLPHDDAPTGRVQVMTSSLGTVPWDQVPTVFPKALLGK